MDWFALNPNNWDADTMHLDPYQDGAYFRLIRHYMKTRAPLPDNDHALARIVGVSHAEWMEKAAAALRPFFKVKGDKLMHKRCEFELGNQEGRSKKQTQKASSGGKARWNSDDDNKAKRHERLKAAREKGTHTHEEWEMLVNICDNQCVKCSSPDAIVKDHITPIYQGGSDHIDNLQPLCRRCNSQKGPDNQDFRPDGWKKRLLDDFHITRHDTTRQDKTGEERNTPSTSSSNNLKTSNTAREEDGGFQKLGVGVEGVIQRAAPSGPFDIMRLLSLDAMKKAQFAAPGWNIDKLASIYNENVRKGDFKPPKAPEGAFIGWCTKYSKGRPPR